MDLQEMVPKEKTVVEPVTGEKPVIKVEPPQQVYDVNKNILKGRRIIWYIWLVIEILLFIRFLLKLFGANQWNIFNILIEILTLPFVLLFNNVFSPTVFLNGNNKIEWSTLFAMFIYLLITFIIARFFKLKKPINPTEAQQKV
jgi:YggT family protein